MKKVCLLLLFGFAGTSHGQRPDVAAQREAMKKLDFLVGKWSGEASMSGKSGRPVKLFRTEDVQYKLDGRELLIEGTGRRANGDIAFQAQTTISYDDVTSKYHYRANNSGKYPDTELTVTSKGFAWGSEAGPAKIRNTMRLNASGEWIETAQVTFGSSPPRTSMELTLRRVSTRK